MLPIFFLFLSSCITGATCNQTQRSRECPDGSCVLRIDGKDVPCRIRNGQDSYGACKPTEDAINTFKDTPLSITNQKFYLDTDNSSVMLNLVWNHRLPEKLNLQGYVVRIYLMSNPQYNKCNFIEFTSSIEISKGLKEFHASCIPWENGQDWLRSEVVISVFPVLKPTTENIIPTSESNVDEDERTSDVSLLTCETAYNTEKELLYIKFNKSKFESNHAIHNGFSLSICEDESYCDKPLFKTFVYPEEDSIFIHLKPPNDNGLYYLQIRPLCDSYCDDIDTPNFSLSGNATIDTKGACIRNGSEILNFEFDVKSIEGSSSVITNFKVTSNALCPKEFQVTVAKGKGSNCTLDVVRSTQSYYPVLSARFDNLTHGNYCVRVYPYSPSCGTTWRCSPMYSKIVTLSEVEPIIHLDSYIPPPNDNWYWYIVAVGCAMTILVTVGMIIRKLLRRRNHAVDVTENGDVSYNPSAESFKKVEGKDPKKVFIATFMKSSSRRKIIQKTIPILEKCLHVKEIAKSLTDMTVLGPAEWIQSTMKQAEKIIFVQPDYDITKSIQSNDPSCEEENIYINAVRFAENNKKIAAKSVIIRFDRIDSYEILQSTIVNRRWSLPQFLRGLFNYIHGEDVTETQYQEYFKYQIKGLENLLRPQEFTAVDL